MFVIRCIIIGFILIGFFLTFFTSVVIHDGVLQTQLKRYINEQDNEDAILLRVDQLKNASFGNLFSLGRVQYKSIVPEVYLKILENDLLKMQESLYDHPIRNGGYPKEAKPYFKGTYRTEFNQVLKVKSKLRGLSAWHHFSEKPSFRVKIKRDDCHITNQRYIELQRPEDILALKNWVADFLGRKLDLITEKTDHVRLFVNNDFKGIYLRTMRQGHDLSREFKRANGIFFKGEASAYAQKWNSHKHWKTFGNELTVENGKYFDDFLNLLKEEASPESIEHLRTVLDGERYARWAALMIVSGSTHTDIYHNHSYFLNPESKKIEPLVWDSNGFGMQFDETVPPNVALHPLMQQIISDPHWVHRRNQVVFELLQTCGSHEKLFMLIEDKIKELRPDLMADSNLGEIERQSGRIPIFTFHSVQDIDSKIQEIKNYIINREKHLMTFLENVNIYLKPHSVNPNWTDVQINGTASATYRASNDSQISQTVLHPGLSKSLYKLNDSDYDYYVKPTSLVYTIKHPIDVLTFSNAITGSPIQSKMGHLKNELPTRSIHPEKLSNYSFLKCFD